MAGFDDIFGSHASGQESLLFKQAKPSSLIRSGSVSKGKAINAASGKGVKQTDASKSKKLKSASAQQTDPNPAAAAAIKHGKQSKSDKPDKPDEPAVVAAVTATGPSAAGAPKPAKRKRSPKDASAPAVAVVHSKSAAAKAAHAAAEKLLKLGGIDRTDLVSPPVHETLQHQAAHKKRKKKLKSDGQKPPLAHAQQTETPAERNANGSAAPAEQPLDVAPDGIEQASSATFC
jgi:hypothetical protein